MDEEPPQSAMNLLVVQTGFLGDIILSSPVWTNLRARFPEAFIAVLTTPEGVPLVRGHDAVDEVIAFDKRKTHSGLRGLMTMASLLRERRFDKVFSLHKSVRTAALLRLAGIPERIGFREAAGRLFYTKTVPRKHLPHEALRNTAILQALGEPLSAFETRLSLPVSETAEARADALLGSLRNERLVGIAPGSVWETKRWTVQGFAAVAEEMIEMGYRVVLLGGPKDSPEAELVAKLVSSPLLNLCGKTDLEVSIAIISRLKLLVTNDSAPQHIASARGIPVVTVFCATIPELGFGPWKTPSECVGVPGLSCRPCGRHGGRECPTGTHACQLKLRPERVVEAAQRVLDRTLGQMRSEGAGEWTVSA